MTEQMNADDVLMGGGGVPAASFAEPGTTWEGKIIAPPQAFHTRKWTPDGSLGELAYYPSGDPIMGVTIDIQTTDRDIEIENDDGVRRIYLDGRYNKPAVRDAVRAAGAKRLEVGGYLKMTFTHREDPMDKRSRKFWEVSYTPVGDAVLMNDSPATASNSEARGTATQLLSIPTLTDAQIAATTGLSIEAVATLRSQTTDPPF